MQKSLPSGLSLELSMLMVLLAADGHDDNSQLIHLGRAVSWYVTLFLDLSAVSRFHHQQALIMRNTGYLDGHSMCLH